MPDIIVMDPGPIVSGNKPLEAMADDLLNLIIEVASGCRTIKQRR